MDSEEVHYYTSLDKCLVGRVRVDISSLAFSEASRKKIPRITDEFKRAFEEGHGTSPHNPQNRLGAYVDSSELDDILFASGLTRDNLRASFLPGAVHPKLNTIGSKIYSFNGRHRLNAAEQFHEAEDRWWTIDLYAFESDHPLRPKFLQKQSEQLRPVTLPSDGEVYQKIRYYHLRSDEDAVKGWKLQLKKSKQKKLAQLLRHKKMVEAFDLLLPFPGLWDGFQLGNMHHHFALHSGEQDLCYLSHIPATWNLITLGEEAIRQAIDIPTVQKLQLRAPSASTLDRDYIARQMDRPSNQSELFSDVEDREKRNLIKQALLRLQVMIPTIKTFHENRRYIGIGVNIIKTLLLDDERPKTSVYKAMYVHWRAPDTIPEEIREGEFRDVTLERPDVAARFCFMQVFLAAIRHLNLGNHVPLKEMTSRKRQRDPQPPARVITRSMNTADQTQILKCAHSLGFRTKKIVNGLRGTEDLVVEVPEPSTESDDGEIIKRRSGTPYANAYKHFRTQLFLPNLRQVRPGSGLNPSVMFVQRDLLNAFFSWAPNGRDFALSVIPTEPVAPLQQVLPGFTSSYRPDAVVTPEQAAPVRTISSLPGSVASPRSSTSSQYTQVMWPSRAYSDRSQGLEETWSQFSLPNLGESQSEGEGNEQSPRERSFASVSNGRRSFPVLELRESNERRPYHTAEWQETNIWSPASINSSELEFPEGLRDERRLPTGSEVADKDERQQFLEPQERNVSSPASTINTGRRSFPELELHDEYMRGERQPFPTTGFQRTNILSLTSTDSLGRRSFPDLEFPVSELTDNDDEIRMATVQSTPAGDLVERRSFPALELPGIELPNGRRSFPAPELQVSDTGYVAAGTRSSLTNREDVAPRGRQPAFIFEECNGMTKRKKSNFNMEDYLKEREGWTMMVLRHNALKTVRFEHIVDHMQRPNQEAGERKYFLIARHYAEQFRTKRINSLSSM